MKRQRGSNNPLRKEYALSNGMKVIDIDVPADNTCLFYTVALGYLLPVLNNRETFGVRYKRLFGEDKEGEAIGQLQRILEQFDGSDSFIDQKDEGILQALVNHDFRKRVVSHMHKHFDEYKALLEQERTETQTLEITQDNFTTYLNLMEEPQGTWGGLIEVRAIQELLGIEIAVYHDQSGKLITQDALPDLSQEVIYLLHTNASNYEERDKNHYHLLLAPEHLPLLQMPTETQGSKGGSIKEPLPKKSRTATQDSDQMEIEPQESEEATRAREAVGRAYNALITGVKMLESKGDDSYYFLLQELKQVLGQIESLQKEIEEIPPGIGIQQDKMTRTLSNVKNQLAICSEELRNDHLLTPDSRELLRGLLAKIIESFEPQQMLYQPATIGDPGCKEQALRLSQLLLAHDIEEHNVRGQALISVLQSIKSAMQGTCYSVFITYAWPQDPIFGVDRWIQQFLEVMRKHLLTANFNAKLDYLNVSKGENIEKYMSKLPEENHWLFIGTETLAFKHLKGTNVRFEIDLEKLRTVNEAKGIFHPIPLLASGNAYTSLPLFLHRRSSIDMTECSYVAGLKQLLASLTRLPKAQYDQLWAPLESSHPELFNLLDQDLVQVIAAVEAEKKQTSKQQALSGQQQQADDYLASLQKKPAATPTVRKALNVSRNPMTFMPPPPLGEQTAQKIHTKKGSMTINQKTQGAAQQRASQVSTEEGDINLNQIQGSSQGF